MSWNDTNTGEKRQLRQISKRAENPAKDLSKNLIEVNQAIRYMSGMMTVMQNGIDQANADILKQAEDFIMDLAVIFGLSEAGDTLNLDWGDLEVVLRNLGSIFRFDFLEIETPDLHGYAQALWDGLFSDMLEDMDVSFDELLLALQGTYIGDNTTLQKIATWSSGLIGIIDMRRKVPLWQLWNENVEVIDKFSERSTLEETEGWTHDPTQGKADLGCALFTSLGDMGVLLSPEPVEVRPGEAYRVKSWAKGTDVEGDFSLGVQWYDEDFQAMHYSDAYVASSPGSDWFLMEGTVTAPEGARYCRRRFAANIVAGQARLDDVRFKGETTVIPQMWVKDLVENLQAIIDWLEALVDQILAALGLSAMGSLADKITDLADELGAWLDDTEDRAAELSTLISNLLSNPASVLGMLPQSQIAGLTTTFNQLQDLFNGLAVTPANTVVSSVKSWLAGLLGWQEQAAETTISMQSQITTVQQVFSVRSNRPLWEGLDPTGESSIPYSALMAVPSHDHRYDKIAFGTTVWAQTEFSGVSDFTIGGASSLGCCIRLESAIERSQITFLAKRSGTVTGLYVDLYKMNANGSFTLLFSSGNLAGDLITTLTWQRVVFTPVLFEQGDIVMVHFRADANTKIAGAQLPAPANGFGFLPAQIGMERNGTAPGTIEAIDAGSAYSGKTVYAQIGSDVGQLNAGRTFADTFNRTTLGSAWATFTGPSSYALNISGGWVRNPTNLVGFGQTYGSILYTMPLATDNTAIEWRTAPSNEFGGVFIGSKSDLSNVVGCLLKNNQANIVTATAMGYSPTVRAGASGSFGGTAWWKLTYTVADKTYRLYREGVLIASWNDSGNTQPHGPGTRFWGIAILVSTGNGNGSTVDEIAAYDVPV